MTRNRTEEAVATVRGLRDDLAAQLATLDRMLAAAEPPAEKAKPQRKAKATTKATTRSSVSARAKERTLEVVRTLDHPASSAEIAELAGIGRGTVASALTALQNEEEPEVRMAGFAPGVHGRRPLWEPIRRSLDEELRDMAGVGAASA